MLDTVLFEKKVGEAIVQAVRSNEGIKVRTLNDRVDVAYGEQPGLVHVWLLGF